MSSKALAPVADAEWCDLLGSLANRVGGSEFVDSVAPFVRQALASGAINPQARSKDGSLLAAATLLAGRVRAQQAWINPDRDGKMTALCPASEALGQGLPPVAAGQAEGLVLALLARGAKPDEHLDDVLAGKWPALPAGAGPALPGLPAARWWKRNMDDAWASPWVLAMQFGLTRALSAMLCLLPPEAVVAARTPDGTPWAAALLAAGHEDCARLLFIAGADPNACDARGRGTVSYARSRSAVMLLSEFGCAFGDFVGTGRSAPWEDWRRAGVGTAEVAGMRAAMLGESEVRETPADRIAAGQWPVPQQVFGEKPHAEMAWTLATVMARPGNRLFRAGLARMLRAAGPFPAEAHGAESLLRCTMAIEALLDTRAGSMREKLSFCKRLCTLAGSTGAGLFILPPTSANKDGPLLAGIRDAEGVYNAKRQSHGSFQWAKQSETVEVQGLHPLRAELRKVVAVPGRLLEAAGYFAERSAEQGQDKGALAGLARALMEGAVLVPDPGEAASVVETLLGALPPVMGGETLLAAEGVSKNLATGTDNQTHGLADLVRKTAPDRTLNWLRAVGEALGAGSSSASDATNAGLFIDAFAQAAAEWPGLTQIWATEACTALKAVAGQAIRGGAAGLAAARREECEEAMRIISMAGAAAEFRAGGERRPRHRS